MKNSKDDISEIFNFYFDDPAFDDAILCEMNVLSGAALVGAGAIMSKLWSKYTDRTFTCKDVNDPIVRYKCLLGILESLIKNLSITTKDCEKTPDPAECKLAILNKIDKLTAKKYKLIEKINDLEKKEKQKHADPELKNIYEDE